MYTTTGASLERKGDIGQVETTADEYSPLDIRTAARRVNVSPHTLRRAIQAGEVPVVRYKNGRLGIWPKEVDAWAREASEGRKKRCMSYR